ncbi:MAG: V8-like Glu-specific endopeptidase [Bacteriovoracaceae bacterium]|jgi:V8-like Glu-specific endopeptidase
MKIFLISLLFITTSYANEKSICGDTDDRILSNEAEVGRASKREGKIGCTATMISKTCAVSAGHCLEAISKLSFNVPNTVDNSPQASKTSDTYFLDKSFIKHEQNGEGDDWVVFKLQKNIVTELFPGEAQGFYKTRLNETVEKGQRVRITGFGSDKSDPLRNFSQQTHNGIIKKVGGFLASKSRLGYNVDTMGGNSGSSIILESTNEIIGVHSHGSCGVWGDYNEGTLISKNKKFKAAIQECINSEK